MLSRNIRLTRCRAKSDVTPLEYSSVLATSSRMSSSSSGMLKTVDMAEHWAMSLVMVVVMYVLNVIGLGCRIVVLESCIDRVVSYCEGFQKEHSSTYYDMCSATN